MILEISLFRSGDRTTAAYTTHISPDELESGINLSARVPEEFRRQLTPFSARLDAEGQMVEVILPDGRHELDVFGSETVDDGPVRLTMLPLYTYGDDCVLINEWDPCDEQLRVYSVDTADFIDSDHDPEAALRMAEAIAEQCPEALEIIAKYMGYACDLGSADARDWLYDYLGALDARLEPYA